MEYIIIIVLIISTLLILGFVYDINISKMKNIINTEETKFKNLVDKYPSNIDICKYILKEIKKEKIIIEENKDSKTSLYIVATNKIIIENINESYTRIQTIAHECLHSIQDKKILLFNFIFSNLYIFLFLIIVLLKIMHKISNGMLYIHIMLLYGFVYYFVRSYLEMDAMTKAKYIAKSYMEEANILNKEEIKEIIESYEKINNIGIKTTNYELLFECLLKVTIVVILFMI